MSEYLYRFHHGGKVVTDAEVMRRLDALPTLQKRVAELEAAITAYIAEIEGQKHIDILRRAQAYRRLKDTLSNLATTEENES